MRAERASCFTVFGVRARIHCAFYHKLYMGCNAPAKTPSHVRFFSGSRSAARPHLARYDIFAQNTPQYASHRISIYRRGSCKQHTIYPQKNILRICIFSLDKSCDICYTKDRDFIRLTVFLLFSLSGQSMRARQSIAYAVPILFRGF